jgi:hypothetical protein
MALEIDLRRRRGRWLLLVALLAGVVGVMLVAARAWPVAASAVAAALGLLLLPGDEDRGTMTLRGRKGAPGDDACR